MDTLPLRILLLEDNKHDYAIIKRTLERSDIVVELIWAQTAEEALQWVSTQPFDLVLTDFKLPGLTGLEMFAQLQQQSFNVPVVFLTGSGNEQVAVNALQQGAQDYLVKDPQQEYLHLLPLVVAKARREWEEKRARAQAEANLEQYAVDLAARNAELQAFAHMVANDLKSPLAVIIGYADVLRQNGQEMSDEDLLTCLDAIGRMGRKMAEIVDALLLLAEVRQTSLTVAPLDSASIVHETVARLHAQIQERQAVLHLPQTWPLAYGYAPWIEAVWVNYLSNGLKYGGQPPQLWLGAAAAENGLVRFWVKDNGSGISPADQARLFLPFTKLNQLKDGHGLGLSIVRHIIEKCGGQVGVDSQPGGGSVFWFTLPANPQN